VTNTDNPKYFPANSPWHLEILSLWRVKQQLDLVFVECQTHLLSKIFWASVLFIIAARCYAAYAIMFCLSVCPSATFVYTLSKRINISSFFSYATPFLFFHTKRSGNIPAPLCRFSTNRPIWLLHRRLLDHRVWLTFRRWSIGYSLVL